jgi:SnoaL-like domain
MTTNAVQHAVDQAAIGRLLASYADVVTRRAWDEVPALFAADAPVVIDTGRGDPIELVGGDGVAAFVAGAVERFSFFEMVPLNSIADVEDDEATGRSYIQEVRQDAASGRLTVAYGLYRDRYGRHGDGWRFAAREYRSLARTGPDLTVVSTPDRA